MASDLFAVELLDEGRHVRGAAAVEFDRFELALGGVESFLPFNNVIYLHIERTAGLLAARKVLLDALGPDKERLIVFYCGFVKCTRSHNAAAFAKKLGYKNVYRFPGGIFAWKGGDYPVEKVK